MAVRISKFFGATALAAGLAMLPGVASATPVSGTSGVTVVNPPSSPTHLGGTSLPFTSSDGPSTLQAAPVSATLPFTGLDIAELLFIGGVATAGGIVLMNRARRTTTA